MGVKIKLAGVDQQELITVAAGLRQQFGARLELDEPVQLGQFDPVYVVYGELAGPEYMLAREAAEALAIDELYGWLSDEPDLDRQAFGFDVMEALLRHADVRYNASAERAEWLFQQDFGTWAVWLNLTRTVWMIKHPAGKTSRVKCGLLYDSIYSLISTALSAD